MRELKFRVWSEEDKEYRTDLNVFRLHDGKIICTSPAYSLEGDRFDVEQYTGLKDKNGKEVYEGDIVLDDECGDIGEVEYHAPNFTFHPIYPIERWNSHYIGKYIKVIGNIHENGDLLND